MVTSAPCRDVAATARQPAFTRRLGNFHNGELDGCHAGRRRRRCLRMRAYTVVAADAIAIGDERWVGTASNELAHAFHRIKQIVFDSTHTMRYCVAAATGERARPTHGSLETAIVCRACPTGRRHVHFPTHSSDSRHSTTRPVCSSAAGQTATISRRVLPRAKTRSPLTSLLSFGNEMNQQRARPSV